MSELAGSVRQLGTHRKLVSRTEQREFGTGLELDAIIVPASRPAQNLKQAIDLAQAARCRLLVLCSRHADSAEVQRLLRQRSVHDAIVIDLPNHYHHELLDFRALASIREDLPAACSYRVTDLSMKRNLGLILARMMGWRRVFFLDDDIGSIDLDGFNSTVSMLGLFSTAGMRVTHYPDNSVVCHAYRETGGIQDVFITGAALAVDCQQNTGFFPDIYNEDWLFFYDAASARRLGSSRSEVTQIEYNPFADPRRAARQEFGDVLAEGLYALLDFGSNVERATSEYWSFFLDARRRVFDAINRRSDIAKADVKEQLLLAVEAARECSAGLSPELFENYVRLWRQDLRVWEKQVTRIRPMPSLDAALQVLGLTQVGNGQTIAITRPRPADASEERSTVPSGGPRTYRPYTRG